MAQSSVILSLGSNSGNRLQNIQSCINYIHNNIATVIKVSGIYETPSWGFASHDFYNCALLVHTQLKPQKLLKKLLKAEEKAGRLREPGAGYQARSIDIDIIAFDGITLEESGLQLPHPRMQDRNFVLYPLRDIAPRWQHPTLHKSIDELISSCTDASECKHVIQPDNPIDKYTPEKFNYITIEGNIGAGKTSLSTKIAQDFNATLILERFADNPFLPKFYKDQQRYAFPLEMSFLADRYHQLSDDISDINILNDFVIADYHIVKSLIFAEVTLGADEYNLYQKMFDIMHRQLKKPGLYVYLHQSTKQLLKQIKRRGRSYEQNIKAEYLDRINKGYLSYINSQQGQDILVIDVTDKDFVNNQKDYIYLLNQIQKSLQ